MSVNTESMTQRIADNQQLTLVIYSAKALHDYFVSAPIPSQMIKTIGYATNSQ